MSYYYGLTNKQGTDFDLIIASVKPNFGVMAVRTEDFPRLIQKVNEALTCEKAKARLAAMGVARSRAAKCTVCKTTTTSTKFLPYFKDTKGLEMSYDKYYCGCSPRANNDIDF